MRVCVWVRVRMGWASEKTITRFGPEERSLRWCLKRVFTQTGHLLQTVRFKIVRGKFLKRCFHNLSNVSDLLERLLRKHCKRKQMKLFSREGEPESNPSGIYRREICLLCFVFFILFEYCTSTRIELSTPSRCWKQTNLTKTKHAEGGGGNQPS